MCQPPEITLQGGGEALEAATSNDAWHSTSSDGWVSPSQGTPASVSWRDEQANLTASSNHSLFAKFGQYQQQQRVGQLAALAGMSGTTTATPQAPAWNHGLGSNLAEKLQRAAAAAAGGAMHKPHDATSLPWMARQSPAAFAAPAPAPAPGPIWAAATPVMAQQAVSPLMGGMPHQLVAQGIPLGMQFAHTEDEDDLDPKKYKRMMSNRASAKRSRQRRQERLDELEIVSAKLQVENSTVQRQLNEANDRIRKFQKENEALQEELRHLRDMMVAKGVTPTTTSHPDNTCPGTMTKQDSCGPNGSTTHQLSSENPSGSSTPPQAFKRPREEFAESRFQGADGPAATRAKVESPVTPSSGTTSDTDKDCDAPAAGPVRIMLPAPHVATGEDALHHEIGGILDDDLFTTFMDECFEAKPIDAALAKP